MYDVRDIKVRFLFLIIKDNRCIVILNEEPLSS